MRWRTAISPPCSRRSGCPIAAEAASRTAICVGAGRTLLADQPGRGAVCPRPPCRSRGDATARRWRYDRIMRRATAICCSRSTTAPMSRRKRSLPNTRTGTAGTRSTSRRNRLPFTLDRTPGRRLRVGYVSADFRQHAVAMFAEPLLAAHDRSNVELYLYAGVAAEDAATERFRSLATTGASTLGLVRRDSLPS